MIDARKAFEFRKQSILSASPVELVVMLYDGALQQMVAGKAAVQKRDLPAQNLSLLNAQKFVIHLMGTLDMEKGGDVSANLFPLYNYVYTKLINANIYDQVEPIEECIKIFSELRDGWSMLDEKLKQDKQAELVAA